MIEEPNREPPLAVRRIAYATDVVIRGMAYLSGVLFLLLSLFVTLDIIGRRFFGLTSAMTDEISGYGLAVGGMWAMAWTLRSGGHVRIDVLLPRLPIRLQAVLGYACIVVMGFFASMLAVYCWELAIDSHLRGVHAVGWMGTPLFVPQALMAIGISVLGLEALAILICGVVTSLHAGRVIEPPILEGSHEDMATTPVAMRQPWDS